MMGKNNLPITQVSQEQALEFSIQKLIKSCVRRQKWKNFFFSNNQNHDNHDQQITQSRWRTKLADFLGRKQVHFVAISLLLVDLTLTTLELTSSLSCHQSKRQESRKTTETWLHWLGVAILGLLLAKTVALAVALGRPVLRRSPGLVVDLVVLAVALLLEVFFEKKGGGLVVVVILWRVIRVLESVFELSDDVIEAQVEEIVKQFKVLSEENKRLLEFVDEKGKVILKLEEDLDKYCRKDNINVENI